MKTNFTAKLFGLTLVTALTLTALTACGNGGAATTASGTASGSALQSGDGGSVGTVLLSVNPEIEMDYDEVGNVVALTGLNEDGKAVLASYTGYEGKPCTTVVGELVDEINAGGYFDATIDGHEKNIVLKLERGSAYPNDQFLNELAEAVRLVVEADQAAAQNILSTQLGRDDIQFVEKEYDLDDGEYEVEFVMDGVEYEYEVNAVTGKPGRRGVRGGVCHGRRGVRVRGERRHRQGHRDGRRISGLRRHGLRSLWGRRHRLQRLRWNWDHHPRRQLRRHGLRPQCRRGHRL